MTINKILVTGGSGFIGSHVVDNLLKRGKYVTIFDRHVKSYYEDCNVFFGDITNKESVLEAIQQNDAVIHLASLLGTQESVIVSQEFVEVNLLGSLNVFEACRLYKKKAVYIAIGNYWMNNPYSITKRGGARFALMYNKEFGTEIAIVRGLNAYGPRQKIKPVKKIMPTFIMAALKNEPIVIYGDGNQVMDMIYVTDLAEILVRALLLEHGKYDTTIEAGLGKDDTVNDIANLIIEKCESKSKIEHVKMRPGEIPGSIVKADTSTLAHVNYSPLQMVQLNDGIEKTIEWYRGNINEIYIQ